MMEPRSSREPGLHRVWSRLAVAATAPCVGLCMACPAPLRLATRRADYAVDIAIGGQCWRASSSTRCHRTTGLSPELRRSNQEVTCCPRTRFAITALDARSLAPPRSEEHTSELQ